MDKEFLMNSNLPQYDHSFSSTMPTWQSIATSMEIQTTQSQDYFLSTPPPNDHFESALSSMVSSPSASNSAFSTDNFMIRELIGKLGNICNSNDISNYIHSTNCSTNNSCYSTPISSPSKMGRSMPSIDHMIGSSIALNSTLPAMPADPGFAERAARFSSFGSRSFNDRTNNHVALSNVHNNGDFVHRSCDHNLGSGNKSNNDKLQRVSSSPSLKVEVVNNDHKEFSKSRENSSISSRNQAEENGSNRKRKAAISKGKGKEIESHSQMPSSSNKVGENRDESNVKRSKSSKENKGDDNKKSSEPQKDYIHVRARRGQATDSHSLAERVRREKIGERMKLLQDLVPGCNRVTGKALMLEEIINYVQSLQSQVEFLSMKLSTVSNRVDMNVMTNVFTKDEIQPNCSLTNTMHQTLQDSITTVGTTLDPLNTTLNHNQALHYYLPSIHAFSNCIPQLPSLSEGDLQSIVEMGFGQNENNQQHKAQTLHGTNNNNNPREMKNEF